MKKNIILCDCESDEVTSLRDGFNSDGGDFEIKSHIANWKRTSKISEQRRYFKYFFVAFRYFLKRKKYGTLVGWQQFYALIFGFFCSVFHTKKVNKVVVLNFTYKEKKGKLARVYRWFMRRCLEKGYVDYIHVPSNNYAVTISESFNFPIDRIIVIPFGINDPYDEFSRLPLPYQAPKEGYVLSIGRSNRDYDFLISAWKNINYPLVIISDTYEGNNKGNSYITIIRNVAGEESYPWIAHCNAMIIPIDDGTICSGDTVLLTALAMKKKVLITTPSTLAEMYIVHGENGLCVKKQDSNFELFVNDMIFCSKYDYLQEKARDNYLNNYSRLSMGKKLKEIVL